MIPLLALGFLGAAVVSDWASEPVRERFGEELGLPPEPVTVSSLADRLKKLSEVGTELTVTAVGRIDSEAEGAIRSIVRNAPGDVLRTVASVVKDAAKAQGKAKGMKRVLARVNITEPDAETASRALKTLAKAIDKSPDIRRLTNHALVRLDKEGIIGSGELSTVISLLGAVAAVGSQVQAFRKGGMVTLVLPKGTISVNKLGRYAVSLATRNPLIRSQQIRLAVSGRPEAPVRTASVELPTTFELGRYSRKLTVSPYAKFEFGPEAEREVGIKARLRF